MYVMFINISKRVAYFLSFTVINSSLFLFLGGGSLGIGEVERGRVLKTEGS